MSKTMDSAPVEELCEMEDSFYQSLTERLDYVDHAWSALQDEENDIEDKKEMLALFAGAVHYLAGGAGIHGFVALSQRAFQILGHIQPAIRKNAFLSKETQFMVDHLVSSLFSLKEHYDESGIDWLKKEILTEQTDSDQPQVAISNDIYLLEPSSDDDALKVFLESMDLRICSFNSFHSLSEAIGELNPRAVLIDLQQVEHDDTASEFIEIVQQENVQFPVIALSEIGDFDSRLQASRVGATHFFTKPVDGYRLVDTLQKAAGAEGVFPSKVLLVDDDPETSHFMAAHLKQEGLDVCVLNNPTDLLDAMTQFHPDLILTDLYMPECSGLELASIIRQHEVYFDIPIVFLTSESDEDTRLAALQLGSDDFFSKSTPSGSIAKAIRFRLERMTSYALVKKAMMWSPN